jgi:hypothetical protein
LGEPGDGPIPARQTPNLLIHPTRLMGIGSPSQHYQREQFSAAFGQLNIQRFCR